MGSSLPNHCWYAVIAEDKRTNAQVLFGWIKQPLISHIKESVVIKKELEPGENESDEETPAGFCKQTTAELGHLTVGALCMQRWTQKTHLEAEQSSMFTETASS